MKEIKKRLHEQCLIVVKERIANAEASLKASHESMMGETKSSAGDKFETSRAMLQGEQDRMKGVVIKTKEMAYNLTQISLEPHDIIQPGSLVVTDGLTYYIASGLGKIKMDKFTYYVISTASPIGQLLLGHKAGQSIVMNGKTIKIKSVK